MLLAIRQLAPRPTVRKVEYNLLHVIARGTWAIRQGRKKLYNTVCPEFQNGNAGANEVE